MVFCFFFSIKYNMFLVVSKLNRSQLLSWIVRLETKIHSPNSEDKHVAENITGGYLIKIT